MEGYQELKNAITTEWNIGLNWLPIQEFSHYFKGSLSNLLEKGLESQKSWFVIIRQGRILHQDPQLSIDDFSHKGPLQHWVGLPIPT